MKTHRALLLTGLLGLTAAPLAASADAPRYDYLDLSYQTVNDPSGSGLSSDHAYGLSGSYAFTDQFIGGASYAHATADFSAFGFKGSASANIYSLGAGFRFPLSSNLDLVPNLSYVSVHSSATLGGFSASTTDNGYDLGVLLRAMVMDKLELDANVDHSSPGASSNTVGVAALYNFTPAFAVGLGYGSSTADGQDTSAWTVALRYYFK